VAKSLARRFTHIDYEYGDDTLLRGAMFESGEEDMLPWMQLAALGVPFPPPL